MPDFSILFLCADNELCADACIRVLRLAENDSESIGEEEINSPPE